MKQTSDPGRSFKALVWNHPPKGWQRRFLAAEPRLSEAVQAYQDLGFQVVLVPALNDDLSDRECKECLDNSYVIYVLARGPG